MTKKELRDLILENCISAMKSKKGITAQIKVDEIVDAIYAKLPKEIQN